MPITDVTKDPDQLTLTVVGEYPVPVDRLWQAWAEPRQRERVWGPPTWPATFASNELVEGERCDYFMTGPDGERVFGYWRIESVEPLHRIELVNGFSTDDGAPDDDLPTMHMTIDFERAGEGSRFALRTTFPSTAAMEQVLAMGMEEGLTLALGQIDDVLADLAARPH